MKSKIFTIYKKEMREAFRDKKSLIMMLVIPILIPVITIAMSYLFDSESDPDIKTYNKIGFSYELTEEEKTIAKQLEIDYSIDTEENLKEIYDEGDIDLYVTKNDNVYTLNGYNNQTTSLASGLVENYFYTYKAYLQKQILDENNLNSDEIMNVINVEYNISEKENFFVNYMLNYIFMFVIMAITVSATYPTTDSTAGEKERGTLETLLTFPVKVKDIIIGKFLAIATSSFITGLISLILMIISVKYSFNTFDIYKGHNAMTLNDILYIFIVVIIFSFMISGLALAIVSKSKTFKEAQSALSPLTFICMMPSLIVTMIDAKSNILTSIIPFVNYSLLYSDLQKGSINYLYVILMVLSSIIFVFILLSTITKIYKKEKVLFSE